MPPKEIVNIVYLLHNVDTNVFFYEKAYLKATALVQAFDDLYFFSVEIMKTLKGFSRKDCREI